MPPGGHRRPPRPVGGTNAVPGVGCPGAGQPRGSRQPLGRRARRRRDHQRDRRPPRRRCARRRPASRIRRLGKAAGAVFAIPRALKAPCAVSYGPVPGAVYAGHRFIDVLIHGWDVAVATRQDTKLRPVLVDACLDIVAAQAELLSASGVFGDKIELADASDAQTRLLATLGRRA